MEKNKIVNFLFEIATLRRLTRNHKQLIAGASDNISDHSFRVAIIGMILAELEKCDNNKVLKMCLFHDVAEARINDANFINQQYVESREEEAIHDQMDGLPIGNEVVSLLKEYEKRQSREAMVAKDADLIDQIALGQEYFYQDKVNGEIWHNYSEKKLKTASAKVLAKKIRETNPFEWMYQLSEDKTGKNIKG